MYESTFWDTIFLYIVERLVNEEPIENSSPTPVSSAAPEPQVEQLNTLRNCIKVRVARPDQVTQDPAVLQLWINLHKQWLITSGESETHVWLVFIFHESTQNSW